VERSTSDVVCTSINAIQINTAMEWAQRQTGIESLGYEETRNIARNFREYEMLPEAVEKFKLASSKQADNWLSQWGLAWTYHSMKEWTLALDTLGAVKIATVPGEAKEDNISTRLSDLDQLFATWNKDAGNDAKAWRSIILCWRTIRRTMIRLLRSCRF
jgi:hypothetical protein